MATHDRVRVAVLGATGYSGVEAVRILAAHPFVSPAVLTSRQYAGREVAEVYRDLYRLKNQKTLSFGERRMLDTARTLIVKEIAIARAQTEENVRNEIESIFFAN